MLLNKTKPFKQPKQNNIRITQIYIYIWGVVKNDFLKISKFTRRYLHSSSNHDYTELWLFMLKLSWEPVRVTLTAKKIYNSKSNCAGTFSGSICLRSVLKLTYNSFFGTPLSCLFCFCLFLGECVCVCVCVFCFTSDQYAWHSGNRVGSWSNLSLQSSGRYTWFSSNCVGCWFNLFSCYPIARIVKEQKMMFFFFLFWEADPLQGLFSSCLATT